MPIPSQTLPEVGTRPMGAPQINVDSRGAFGEAVGTGLQQVAGGVQQLAEAAHEAKAKADISNTMARLGEARAGVSKVLYSTAPDASGQPVGFVWKEGHRALEGHEDAYRGIQSAIADAAAGLVNDEQRRLFQQHADGLVREAQQQIELHSGKQIQVAQANDFKSLESATVAGAAARAIADPTGAVASALKDIDSLDLPTRLDAQHRGLGTQAEDEQVRAGKAAVASATLNALIASKTPAALRSAQALLAVTRPWLGPEAAQYDHNLRTIQDDQASAIAAFRYANDAVTARDVNGAPLQIDDAKAFAALDADFEAGNIPPERWKLTRAQLQERIKDLNESAKQVVGNYAAKAMQQFMAPGPGGKPRLSLAAVDSDTRAWLTDPAHGEEAAKVWEQLVKWDNENSERSRRMAQMPTPDQDARALALRRALARPEDAAKIRSMSTADLIGLTMGTVAIPGEEGAPAVAISSRDFPEIRNELGSNAKPPPPEQIIDPKTVAQQEFEDAFGLKRIPSKRWTAPQSEALRQTTDEVSRWVNSEIAKGRKPTDADIREHLSGKGGILQRLDRKRILGIEYGPGSPLEAGTAQRTPAPARGGTPSPPVPGAKRVTDGKQHAWLPPGTAMPTGWREE
ncbi:hypothetical protein [Anaeromyxobacter paludicola]|uniref:Uncharacterized protein n=1 Tax=Anaeromyxobacter paludicola TaxID=2918171 RepID=A0ABM7X5C1_9BACT|nr:hypothetical protein [Anaeromyxobacter paludicola]BDG06990.1 hypothetical protein AMPC_01030 [Anaeromyxobacter paludicola]